MQNSKDQYFVAVKIFLEDKKGNFFISKDKFGDWDLPGGRLRQKDFKTPLKNIIARKMREELGNKIKYKLDTAPVVFFRHERNEILESDKNGKALKREKRRIFALGYRAKLISGTITLGKHHIKSLWVNPKMLKPKKYFYGGWLKGVGEYLKLK